MNDSLTKATPNHLNGITKYVESKEVIARRAAAQKARKVAATYLNKSEASHYLHTIYDEWLVMMGYEDIHPNFQSLINENIRNPISPSAVKQGYPKGNKGKYSKIDHLRMRGRPMFLKAKLRDWFNFHYAPTLAKTAA